MNLYDNPNFNYQSTWDKQGGLPSIYDQYRQATNIAGDYVDETYNPTDPYTSEGLAGDVRHVVGSSMAKDQLQNLLGDYITPGSPLAEKVTYGLGMGKTYAEEISDAARIGKQTIQAGDWDKIFSGEFLTHPLEDIKANRIGLSIPYGSTEEEKLSYVPGMEKFMMNKKATQKGIVQAARQRKIREAEAARVAQEKAAAQAAANAAQAAKTKRLQQQYKTYQQSGGHQEGGGGQQHTGGGGYERGDYGGRGFHWAQGGRVGIANLLYGGMV